MIWFLSLVGAACGPLPEPAAVVVTAGDPALASARDRVAPVFQSLVAEKLSVRASALAAALNAESGAKSRTQALNDGRAALEQARLRFRDLDPEGALEHLAKVTPRLVENHQLPQVVELLAKIQLLAGTIYLAMGRRNAAQVRLHRSLDFVARPAPEDLGAPGLAAEVAAVRAQRMRQPSGRLAVRWRGKGPSNAQVYIDGRRVGVVPFDDYAVPARRHLLRVQAPGFRSYVASVEVPARGHRVVEVGLQADPEQQALAALPGASRLVRSSTPTLALIAERTGARSVVWLDLRVSRRRDATATATLGFELTTSAGGRSRGERLDVEVIRSALTRALACEVVAPLVTDAAPAFVPKTALTGAQGSMAPKPWWQHPGVFAVVAASVLGGVALAVGLRAGRGEPTGAEILLVPRP